MKLIKTTIFSSIITIIKIASGFVASKIVAIFTGPGGVAIVGAFGNFITIALTFANGAINTGIVKYTAEYGQNQQKIKKLFSTSLRISVVCSLVLGLILLLSSEYISSWIFGITKYSPIVKVLGITILFYSLNSLLISILNGRGELRTFTVVNTIGSIIGLIFTVCLVYFFKLNGALYALVLAQSVVFFITTFLVIRRPWFEWGYFSEKIDWKILKNLSKFSLMAIVSAITVPVSQIILRNLIINNLGVDSAGYWQGILKISDGYLLIITTSLSTYYLPKLSALKSEIDIRKEIFYTLKIVTPAVLVGCVAIYISRSLIIKTLYTAEFQEMESLFLWQLVGDFFKMIAWVIGYIMIAKAMTKMYVITDIIFNFLYVVSGFLFIHRFGLIGSTFAFTFTYLIYLITMVILFKRILFSKKLI
ncbi:O-antigen translocase [Pedobacter aquatilis]|uniref:O-antigen translocase n=1 Tax=Pedobacter aquatilis TaxID=351343 RepID=UPI00292D2006|nr:O-antigen translocase [Pedobacter aquatilis]